MKFMMKAGVCAAVLAASSYSASAHAAFAPGVGWTEVAVCAPATFTNKWGHPASAWGSRGSFVWHATPTDWWTYAQPGISSLDCRPWKNGSIVGGATYRVGSPSVPQGVNVSVYSYWNDFNVPSSWTVQNQCGHMHVSTYIWGWRYNGNSWGYEFNKAHMLSSYWNTSTNRCEFKGDGNPEYVSLPSLAFGPPVLTVNNSPYAVIYTKTQATSHRGAACGQFECFHPLMVIATY